MTKKIDDRQPEGIEADQPIPSRRTLLEGLGLTSLFAAVPSASDAKARGLRSSSKGVDRAFQAAIDTIVVIYAENRSFNNLFPEFPGLRHPLNALKPEHYLQRDRDGRTLETLPPIWGGLAPDPQVVNHQTYRIAEADLTGLANKPFALTTASGDALPQGVVTRDLVHAFYQSQMQINEGLNDRFVAWGDSGAMVMGHYGDNPVNMRLWRIARDYTLCDNFFMGSFGGSFLAHQYLVAARPPFYPNAADSPAKGLLSELEGSDALGTRLKTLPDSPVSASDGRPRFGPTVLTPDFFAVNTMNPPYQPGATRSSSDPNLADPLDGKTLPPQSHATIGDRLTTKGVDWAWYAGGWQAALDVRSEAISDTGPEFAKRPNFQPHHQPFNYFAQFAPGTVARARHLRDGGIEDSPRTNRFMADIEAGKLPSVTFYKPQGNLNMHAGYSDVEAGDRHIATIVNALQSGPQWDRMAIIITFDENGGWWDHVPPPKGDRWGPGTRIPAIVVSPHGKRGKVDHTLYDTGSIARLIIRRFGLETLPGLTEREHAMRAAGGIAPGDLTNAFNFG